MNKKIRFLSFLVFSTISLVLLFLLVRGVRNHPTLVYYCEISANDRRICYKEIDKGAPEKSFGIQTLSLAGWRSHDVVVLEEFVNSQRNFGNEYHMLDLETDTLQCITCGAGGWGYKKLSPSGTKFIGLQDRNLYMFDLATSQKTDIGIFELGVSNLTWAQDESFVIFGDHRENLYRFNVNDRTLSYLLKDFPNIQIFDLALTSKGNRIAFYLLDKKNNLFIVTMPSSGGEMSILVDVTPRTRKVTSSENPGSSFSWSPDGSQIAYTMALESPIPYSNRDGLFIVDINNSETNLIDDSPIKKWSPAWSNDGSLIAYVGEYFGEYPDIWTISPNGANLTNATNTPERIEIGPSWKP
jgi:Tol biopolymer transport system component